MKFGEQVLFILISTVTILLAWSVLIGIFMSWRNRLPKPKGSYVAIETTIKSREMKNEPQVALAGTVLCVAVVITYFSQSTNSENNKSVEFTEILLLSLFFIISGLTIRVVQKGAQMSSRE
jgi:hypothetical protein